ncbi:MAG: Type 1 glutamine amidotransferase-like domain-containing protein, partial [Dietzia sp.]|nr:Type 1 glutamine amidotransferase-like domain-containing protein [Dietzia sp.]
GHEPGNPMVSLGWKSVGLLELTALPSIPDERWMPQVRDADVLLVSGGDAIYLHHWLRESGMLDLLGDLDDTVWVGMSAGSMVMAPRIGEEFVGWKSPLGDRGLGFVDFAICPHLAVGDRPGNSMEVAERWASKIDVPAYVMDDETAIVVDGDRVEVVSEGVWHRLGD